MTQAEFEKIQADFDAESRRYEALKPGQRIYVFEMDDNFEHEVVSVDVPNRVVRCLDHSRGGIEVDLRGGWRTEPLHW